MECMLCVMWNRMPYARRHTTPTTAQETEGALVVGYWLHSRRDVQQVPRICERHMQVLGFLDQQEERRMAAEAAMRAQQPPTPHYAAQADGFQARAQALMGGQPVAPPAPPPPMPPPFVEHQAVSAPFPAGSVPPQPGMCPVCKRASYPGHVCDVEDVKRAMASSAVAATSPFVAPAPPPPPQVAVPGFDPTKPLSNVNSAPFLQGQPGLVPLDNGVTPTVQPPLPVPIAPMVSAPPMPVAPPIVAVAPPVQQGPIGNVEGAMLAARAAPQPGAKTMFTCPSCNKEVETGAVHAC